MNDLGRLLLTLGTLLAALGAVLLLAGKIPFLGRLPGDLVFRRPGFTVYLPLGTCLLVSALLSLLLWILRR